MAPHPSPWFRTKLRWEREGRTFTYQIPHDVFSTLRIDEGTELLLDALPSSPAGAILDLGCGYGALGLPVAARNPAAIVEMVDRDLLAVEWAQKNAIENGLANLRAYGSLGYRETKGPYDWILCNVPARIGTPFIRHLFESGPSRLKPGGEIRVVVIRDLGPVLEALAQEFQAASWGRLEEVVRGPRHAVWRFSRAEGSSPSPDAESPSPDLYLRDRVPFAGMSLDRPFDLGGDDPKRLSQGLPLVLDFLPKAASPRAPQDVLIFRCGYGPLVCEASRRWPQARLTDQDRDLLATEFTRRNLRALGLGIRTLSECVDLRTAQAGNEFDLIVGELSAGAGRDVAITEVQTALSSLAANGQAYFLMFEKLEREWMSPWIQSKPIPLSRIAAREGYVVMRGTRLKA